jgi:hypothetical protein
MKRTSVLGMIGFVVVGASVILAACSSSAKVSTGKAAGTVSTTTTGPTTTTTEATTTTTVSNFKVGDVVTTKAGNRITLHAWTFPAQAGNPYTTASAGTAYGAADVEGCAAAGGSGGTFGPFDFQIQMADNTRLQPTYGGPGPMLNSTTLAAGDCVRGWISYNVPVGGHPAFLVYGQAFGSESIKWALG